MIDRLEARLAGRFDVENGGRDEGPVEQASNEHAAVTAPPAEPESVPLVEGMAPLWLDEAAESAFRAEARDRGEVVVATAPAPNEAEPAEAGALPPLEELVQRIPGDVREALEDLFRARFVAVKRIPRKALKG